ncbi:hypothetical protein EJ02DRAFT_456804 [Clathrospora elynae]|uniref:Uncharacterized protein n=1 Tax=Clathrospora elynae TaxID=706981 RepID=A0A6A5SIT5_9PLEO|nr:hypothetical protein EJ02DRAFT_456804 [Clathrospora elynae]
MSDVEQKTPNKTGASGAAWSDSEKIAYLIVLCENEGKIEGKIAGAPIPDGRSIVSCKKLLWRLKEKHKDDINNIKNGQPLGPAPTGEQGETTTPVKPKAAPRKRKTKAETEATNGDVEEGSPKKKAGGHKKQVDVVKEENVEDKAVI